MFYLQHPPIHKKYTKKYEKSIKKVLHSCTHFAIIETVKKETAQHQSRCDSQHLTNNYQK